MTVFAQLGRRPNRCCSPPSTTLAGSAAGPVPAPAQLEDWLTPLQYPNKVICTGANYYDHVVNDGGHASFSKEDNIPVFFLKPPTTTLVGQGRSVRYPTQTEKFDYELELAFVIGKRGRHIPVEHAREHIAGYTIALDLSARDWQRHPKHLVKFDLFGGKVVRRQLPAGPRHRAGPVRRRHQPAAAVLPQR